jgi:hypothetical protein
MGKRAAKRWEELHRSLSPVTSAAPSPTVRSEEFTLIPLRPDPPPMRSGCCSGHGHGGSSCEDDIETGGERPRVSDLPVVAVTMDRG